MPQLCQGRHRRTTFQLRQECVIVQALWIGSDRGLRRAA